MRASARARERTLIRKLNLATMKRNILLTLLLLLASFALRAQEIVIGDRVPDFRPAEWLGAEPAEDDRRATLFVFYHTESQPCVDALPHIDSLARTMQNERVIIVAMEPKERIAPTLARYMSQNFYVAIDPTGRIFSSFGIRYVPFGVMIDRKGRACWIGNPLLATEKIIRDNLK